MHAHTYISADYSSKAHEGIKAVIYTGISPRGKPHAIAFVGRKKKPAFNYAFRSDAALTEYVGDWVEKMEARKKEQDAYKEKRKAFTHTLEVGSILNSSWGYDQTNVCFYEVIEVISLKTVVVRRIAAEAEYTESMSGTKLPIKGDFVGEPLKKRVVLGNRIKINDSESASPWSGSPCPFSSYA